MTRRFNIQKILSDPLSRQSLTDTATAGVISRLTRTPHTILAQMDYETRYKTIQNMEKYGGGFAKSLARAWYAADVRNKQRIEAAFPDYIEEYGPGGSFWRTEVRSEGVDPGIGKSSVVNKFARENEMDVIDVRLSQLAPTDIRGLPSAPPTSSLNPRGV